VPHGGFLVFSNALAAPAAEFGCSEAEATGTAGSRTAGVLARAAIPPTKQEWGRAVARSRTHKAIRDERCGRQSLVDHEHLRIYPDPDDLRTFVLNTVGEPWPACRGCGQEEWEFAQAASVNQEWLWVCLE